jgi:cytochrome b pre-mRNA-processing protein 3
MRLLQRLFGNRDLDCAAHGLYSAIVAQARRPEFYINLGAPDTVEGRFDMIVLHAVLLMRRLKREDRAAHDLSQAVFDLMFDDMDHNLREMGVGDLAVGKRVKKMAQAFYGRLAAYGEGLDRPGDSGLKSLAGALARNLYAGSEPAPHKTAAMAKYLISETAAMNEQSIGELMAGRVMFGAPPKVAGEENP